MNHIGITEQWYCISTTSLLFLLDIKTWAGLRLQKTDKRQRHDKKNDDGPISSSFVGSWHLKQTFNRMELFLNKKRTKRLCENRQLT